MNKSYRIRTDINVATNKNIKLKLEQEVDTFEILSLKIDQKDVYEAFNCDYGMIIGRVNANGAVGIPNARVSIFIPISDDDKQNKDIRAIYPYETPRDKNAEGKRYNLLPRVAQVQTDNTVRPKQPFGTFPTKEEVVTNDSWLEVYDKYYKFSTITNESGDYMLFGVPIGTQTVHLSVDITDIGRFSMTPATMVTNLGYSRNLFTDNGTKIKPSIDLDDLPNIETQEISVDVIPFCGDNEIFDIGITRQDFRIRAELVSTFTIFGSGFTNGKNESWIDGDGYTSRRVKQMFREHNLVRHMATNRVAEVTEQIFYYPSDITDAEIANTSSDPLEERMRVLSDTEYAKFTREGDFVYIIPCNRDKVITNEVGDLVIVPNDNPAGAFTKFKGFLTLEINNETLPLNDSYEYDSLTIRPVRYKFKFPQSNTTLGQTLEKDDIGTNINSWRKQHHSFELNKIYSIARFHGTTYNSGHSTKNKAYEGIHGFIKNGHSFDLVNTLILSDFYNVGVIKSSDDGDNLNSLKEFPMNNITNGSFGANWLNFTVYFPQNSRYQGAHNSLGYLLSNTNFVPSVGTKDDNENDFDFHWVNNNTQPIAASIVNTQFYPRIDLHFTDIIEVPKEDIIAINNEPSKGFTDQNLGTSLLGDYRNGDISANPKNIVPVPLAGDKPQGSGKVDGDPNKPLDTKHYFYKGLDGSNCTKFMADLGLV